MKKIISMLLVLACLVGVFSVMSVSAVAAEPNADVKEMSKMLFQNVGTSQYLNFDYGTLKNGTYVRVWPKDGSAEQLWDIVKVSDTTYRIQTNKSSKYCLDVYRGSAKLKAGQKCDIWKTGADAYAQNVVFYRCDNGNYIIRMAEAPELAIAATASKDRVKLVKFDETSKYQQWVIKDSKGNKVNVLNDATIQTPVGISDDAYVKTGKIYTVSGVKYHEAKTLREYNGVVKDSVFFLDKNGIVVTNGEILNKLYSLNIFADIQVTMRGAAESWVDAADAYYDVCTSVANNEKLGSLIGKTSGILLNVGAGNTFKMGDAAIAIWEEFSPENVKVAVLIGMLRLYSNNAIASGSQAANLMKSPVTDYEVMTKCVELYSECAANFAAVEYLGGEQVREMANSSLGKELSKYFKNVFLGFADSVIPNIKSVEITKYVTDGVVSLTDFALNSGANAVYEKKLVEYDKLLNLNFESAKSVAEKLSQPEVLKFVNALTSKYQTNVTTQKWGAYYKGHGYHLGVDLGTKGNKSTNVVSIADGVVYRVVGTKNSGGWGNLVIVKHTTVDGKTFYSGYGHLASIDVSVGTKVDAGTKLGLMGSTGNSTGPHLHLLVFTGSLAKNSVPKGYVSSKISNKSYKVNGITYYNPLEVIATQGAIIK